MCNARNVPSGCDTLDGVGLDEECDERRRNGWLQWPFQAQAQGASKSILATHSHPLTLSVPSSSTINPIPCPFVARECTRLRFVRPIQWPDRRQTRRSRPTQEGCRWTEETSAQRRGGGVYCEESVGVVGGMDEGRGRS